MPIIFAPHMITSIIHGGTNYGYAGQAPSEFYANLGKEEIILNFAVYFMIALFVSILIAMTISIWREGYKLFSLFPASVAIATLIGIIMWFVL